MTNGKEERWMSSVCGNGEGWKEECGRWEDLSPHLEQTIAMWVTGSIHKYLQEKSY